MEKKGERIAWVDSVKGFAILCVVLLHVTDGYLSNAHYAEHEETLRLIWNVINAFCMPLFFTVSGYLFKAAYVSQNGELRRERLRRQRRNLLAVFALYSMGMTAVRLLASSLINGSASVKTFLTLWIVPIAPYWYLYILLMYYIVMGVDRIRRIKPERMLPVLLTISAVMDILPSVSTFEFSRFWIYSPCFYAGYLYCNTEKTDRIFPKLMDAAKIAVLLIGGGLLLGGWRIKGTPIFGVIFAFLTSFLLIDLFRNIRFLGENRVLGFVGGYCLEIYVLHIFFTAGFRALIFTRIDLNIVVDVLLNALLSASIPVAFAMCAKKLKIHALFFKPYTFFKKLCSKKTNENI